MGGKEWSRTNSADEPCGKVNFFCRCAPSCGIANRSRAKPAQTRRRRTAGWRPPMGAVRQRDGGFAMSRVLEEVLAANAKYAAEFGDKGNLPMPPGRRFAILTC